MNRIKRAIKKRFGKKIEKKVIIDTVENDDAANSYCGNSISSFNVLIVTNIEDYKEINLLLENKVRNVNILKYNNEAFSKEVIIEASNNIGRYDCIMNIFDDSNINNDGMDLVKTFYKSNQVEIDYLCDNDFRAKLCNVAIVKEDFEQEYTLKSMLEGISSISGNHFILQSGLVVRNGNKLKEIINAVSFLVSKYGDILTGQVLYMDLK